MDSWILKSARNVALKQSAPTTLQEGEVKVKVEKALFTLTDYEIYSGETSAKYPFVMCSNAMGVVSDIYEKEHSLLQKMDRVVIEPYVPCNVCEDCHNDDFEKCVNMTTLGITANGLLQNFVDLPHTQLHHLPDSLSDEKALFVPYLSFCLNVVDSLALQKGKHVAIFASSKTGLLLAQLVAYYKAVPIFVSDKDVLLETAHELGIFYCFNPNECNLEKEIMLVTGGRMCEKIAYFSNSQFTLQDMHAIAATNAQICLVGKTNKQNKISVAQLCKKRLSLYCVDNGAGNYSSAINLLVTNTINIDKLIGNTIAFANLDKELAKITENDLVLESKIVKID